MGLTVTSRNDGKSKEARSDRAKYKPFITQSRVMKTSNPSRCRSHKDSPTALEHQVYSAYLIDHTILKSKAPEREGKRENTKNGYASPAWDVLATLPVQATSRVSRGCRDWHWDRVRTCGWTRTCGNCWIQNTWCVLSCLHFRTFRARMLAYSMC